MAKDVIMPVLGMSQDSGVLLKWLKQEGDEVTRGDVLMEVETDKAVVEIEAQAAGTLANISAQEGEDVPTGQVIAIILEAGESAGESPSQTPPEAPSESSPTAPTAQSASAPPETTQQAPSARESTTPANRNGHTKILASPKAKRLARERGINLAELLGTGSDKVIVAQDVLEYVPAETALTSPTSPDVATEAAAQLTQNLPVMGTVFDDVQADADVTALLGYLERTQRHLPAATLRHLLIRFCAAVLRKHPLGSDKDALHIAVYDLEHDQPSLITDAAKQSMAEIAEASSETSEVNASFALHDFTDSGVARAKRHPHPPTHASLTLGHVSQNQMTLTLTYDSTISTREAAAFLRTLSQLIQQPDDLIFLF